MCWPLALTMCCSLLVLWCTMLQQATQRRDEAATRIQTLVRMHLARIQWVRTLEYKRWEALQVQ